MPNRFVQKNGATVELLTRVPMNRGSLLKSIDNLLKTIETSENAVMIPTLLKDKVRVDACELLFVAKILKASILGHSDLVEFYMNHIGHTSSLLQQPSQALHNDLFSTSIRLQQSQIASPLLSHSLSSNTFTTRAHRATTAPAPAPPASASAVSTATFSTNTATTTTTTSSSSASSSVISSASSSTTTTTATTNAGAHTAQTTTTTTSGTGSVGGRSSSGSTSWMTASQHQQHQQQQSINGASSLSSGNSFSSTTSSSNETPATAAAVLSHDNQVGANSNGCDNSLDTSMATMNGAGLSPPDDPMAHEALLATASKTLLARQAQPPSLLQLTTTNNHINSMSDMFTQLSPTLEHLTSQLASMQQQQQLQAALSTSNGTTGSVGGGIQFEGGALSISTSPANTTLDQFLANGGQVSVASAPQTGGGGGGGLQFAAATNGQRQQQQQSPSSELKSSRSAGCLFRANSGASSPRTPNPPGTPYPQAETLAGATSANGLVGDPKALIKLLLQVEQLKSSISHVTTLLESVVELYKKSIDNIA